MPATASAATGSLAWEPCPDAATLQCATLKVPLDYRKPDGATIDIAVSRLASTNPAKRRGVMLMNPGGPGGPGLPYITSANTARDMDRIREALGEKKISYYGVSYGSYLGAVYSTLFPRQADRVVLDSVTGPGGLDPTGSRRLAEGFQDRFPDFASWAAARHDSYGLRNR